MAQPRSRIILTAACLAAAASLCAAGIVWWLDQSAHVSTSDARVRAHMIAISPDIEGRIAELDLRAGDAIVRGQPLVQLDSRRASLALAKASLDLDALEIDIEIARRKAGLDHARGGKRITAELAALDAAHAEARAAGASLIAAEADFRRKQALHASGHVADAAIERTSASLEIARQTTARSRAILDTREADLGRARVDAAAAALVDRDADRLAIAASGLRQQVASLKLDLDQHTIASPIDGVIDEVFADEGEYIQRGARIALAHSTADLWIEANIKETDIARVQPGAYVAITLDAAHRACTGAVARIGHAATSEFALVPNANPTGVFTKITQRIPVRIHIGADCDHVRPGAMATLRIRAQ